MEVKEEEQQSGIENEVESKCGHARHILAIEMQPQSGHEAERELHNGDHLLPRIAE